jgi:1,4-alpha-glucan branching enzyme
MNRTNISYRVRLAILFAAMLAASVSGCTVTSVIRNRLPAPHPVEGGILFQYDAPSAKYVNLAGNFNTWGGTEGSGRFDPTIDPMTDEDGDGVWMIIKDLRPGRYQYKFVIDRGVRWELDPSNTDYGEEGGFTNSLIIVK